MAAPRMILHVAGGDAKADAVAAASDGPIDLACSAPLRRRHACGPYRIARPRRA